MLTKLYIKYCREKVAIFPATCSNIKELLKRSDLQKCYDDINNQNEPCKDSEHQTAKSRCRGLIEWK